MRWSWRRKKRCCCVLVERILWCQCSIEADIYIHTFFYVESLLSKSWVVFSAVIDIIAKLLLQWMPGDHGIHFLRRKWVWETFVFTLFFWSWTHYLMATTVAWAQRQSQSGITFRMEERLLHLAEMPVQIRQLSGTPLLPVWQRQHVLLLWVTCSFSFPWINLDEIRLLVRKNMSESPFGDLKPWLQFILTQGYHRQCTAISRFICIWKVQVQYYQW